jgi:DNA-binding response OmpR family regulator
MQSATERHENRPTVLLVDDNRDLLRFLERVMVHSGWTIIAAESAAEAKQAFEKNPPAAALLDYMLPDGNGVELALKFRETLPDLLIIMMTGTILAPEEEALCEEHEIPILRKPFLASDVMNQIRARLEQHSHAEIKFTSRALKVFFSYSHRDEKLRDRLDAHLSALKHMDLIHSWHDRKITAGSDFKEAIDRYLDSADLVLLLISPDFLNSEYCYSKEMKRALERHASGQARVVPVILRPVDWEKAPFAHLQAVPKDGRPITRWPNRDEGFLDAAKGIRRAAEELSASLNR